MAQVEEQHGVSEAVIYDSQEEEEDRWPESQSSVQDALAVTDTSRRRPQLLKVYGRSKVHCDLGFLNNRASIYSPATEISQPVMKPRQNRACPLQQFLESSRNMDLPLTSMTFLTSNILLLRLLLVPQMSSFKFHRIPKVLVCLTLNLAMTICLYYRPQPLEPRRFQFLLQPWWGTPNSRKFVQPRRRNLQHLRDVLSELGNRNKRCPIHWI